jgi:hypothetical protein
MDQVLRRAALPRLEEELEKLLEKEGISFCTRYQVVLDVLVQALGRALR